MTFTKEAAFETALIEILCKNGWEKEVIKYPTEEELLKNWAAILFENNRDIDRLDNKALTVGEMQQIMEQITALRTPLKLNGFINGKTVSITRDNPEDARHFGKEISLKIYDRREIAAGQSRYQIVRQPQFKSKSKILSDRRGDLMLLINGMPVIHIELKKSGVSLSQAYHQIEKYSDEGLFTGLFSLIQIFVAMEPEKTLYFANPGPEGRFNKDFYFHWADFNNEPINEWKKIASSLLSIPMAHQLIGFYTVADGSDGVLKVLRSYQYIAANAISNQVSKIDWKFHNGRGGYVWHTTGSGKTMTSFKSAQLIANSKDADKVIFLMDRIELGTQSLREYRNFAEANESVQATENSGVLVTKMKSANPADTLIVTSIQKMSKIKDDEDGGMNAHDIALMNTKRIVFIVDEAHRSTFGEMLGTIKSTFPQALFFGFTGTPIHEENQKKDNTTTSIFGNELHRYSIADGIRDKNVLGFYPYKVLTYQDKDIRVAVALEESKAQDEVEAFSDPKKKIVFNKFMNDLKMAGHTDKAGTYIKGIEDYIPRSQYERNEHREKVIQNILENWVTLSQNRKYHALFATSSISEAIEYYRLLKKMNHDLKITALFDPNIDNNGGVKFKEDGLVEIIEDYNKRYEQDFSIPTHDQFKKDIAARLAHKEPYIRIERNPEQQIDLLIVVDQMLTGFDSKWINTLYLDKLLHYENIIQAFSRTNRLFGSDKPFGSIRYYRLPHTMERNIYDAVKLYSGDKPYGLFVEHLDENLKKMNASYSDIAALFTRSGVPDFTKIPDNLAERGKFAVQFRELNAYLEAAKIQGFTWKQLHYEFGEENGKPKTIIDMQFDENTYLSLALRYKELFAKIEEDDSDGGITDIPFEIDGYLTEIDTGKIDADYMNTRFEKYLKMLVQEGIAETEMQQTLDELHKSFAYLTQDEQKYANIFLHDVECGYASMESGKTFRDYVTEYQYTAKNDQISALSRIFRLDKKKLLAMMNSGITEANINEFGRFDELKATVDKAKAKQYFDRLEGADIAEFKVNIKVHNLLKKFILNGGFEI
ncbi:HsdR family type I site-specific deoxyribonuclease [Treponema sp.]